MEKDELLKVWMRKLGEDLGGPFLEPGDQDSILECLDAVFEVGRQTGKDEEKLARQLSELGKPHGI